jgi:hypothetical protein
MHTVKMKEMTAVMHENGRRYDDRKENLRAPLCTPTRMWTDLPQRAEVLRSTVMKSTELTIHQTALFCCQVATNCSMSEGILSDVIHGYQF